MFNSGKIDLIKRGPAVNARKWMVLDGRESSKPYKKSNLPSPSLEDAHKVVKIFCKSPVDGVLRVFVDKGKLCVEGFFAIVGVESFKMRLVIDSLLKIRLYKRKFSTYYVFRISNMDRPFKEESNPESPDEFRCPFEVLGEFFNNNSDISLKVEFI